MFKNIPVESRPSRQDDDLAESDDDTISLTSTVPPDDDQQYVVESILAERPNQDGIMYYLVQWDSTQFDAFWDSTWEPAESFNEELSAQWAETKAKQEAGEEKPFDVDKYFRVQARKVREKRQRHNRRNAKRARLGLPLTKPFPTSSASKSTLQDEDSSDDEASEDDDVVEVSVPQNRPPKPRKTSSTSTQKKGVARPISTTAPKSPTKSKAPKAPSLSKTNKDRQTSLPSKPVATSDPQASSSAKKRQAAGQSSTGYEGTARKPSKDDIGGPSKSKTKESNLGSNKGAYSSITVASGQKTITAKKSSQKTVQSKTGNIFTGGKVRKKRAVIEEVMSNPTKDPKHFSNMHIGRVAQLRSRAREDIAPDPSQVALFPLTEGPSAARKISKETEQPVNLPAEDDLFVGDYAMVLQSEPQEMEAPIPQSRTGLTPILTGLLPKASTGLTPTSAGISPRSTGPPPASAGLPPPSAGLPLSSPTSTGPISRPPLKKRKSVRWDDDVNSVIEFREPDPMDLDHDTPGHKGQIVAPSQPAVSLAARPPTPPPVLSAPEPNVTTIITQGHTRSQKRVTFGKTESGPKFINTTFNGLPDGSRDDLYARFLATDNLEFNHSCLATSVVTVLNSMIKTGLAFGGLSSDTDTDKQTLDNVVSSLRAGIMGLLCAQAGYSILIYPSKCEEWNAVQLKGLPASAPSEFELLYYIFAPQEPLLALLPQSRSVSKPPSVGKELSNRQLIMEKFFGFDYQRLLPANLKPSSTHNFFLAFPDSKLEMRLLFFHWLRSCNPDCCIFISQNSGSWHAFQSKLTSERTMGVVIIHELMTWVLHRIPNLGYYLRHRDDKYWCLTEPISILPMYPSTNSQLEEEPVAPGHLQLTRLFPLGTAILLTPSFLVSEPIRALEIIDWFLTYFAKSTTSRLITAWDIATYLRDLAWEKEQERTRLLTSPEAMESTASLAILENLKGLSRDDCESRFIAATKAFELHDLRSRKVPPVGDNEESATLVYAIDSIDPNDEQSLVNWFGYWSTLRMDQFRHFYVLGSDDTITARRSERGERDVPVPRYTEVTLNDPDSVMKATLDLYHDRNMEAEQSAQARVVVDDTLMSPAATSSTAAYQAFTTHEVRSECFTRIDTASFIDMLRDVGPKNWDASLWILYGFPVSWWDSDMADHFGDFKHACHTISTWFNWSYSWGGKTGMTRYNTYVGFFYTIADDWDPANKPTDRTPKRHPWLAFYRPRNAFKRPWEEAELIIWDPAAPRRFGNRPPTESELTFMQRQVINYVRKNSPEKNHGSKLTDVWLGGYMIPEECRFENDVDVVATFLQTIGNEQRFKNALPASSHSLERPNKGYRRVQLTEEPSRERPGSDSEDVEMDIEDSERYDDEDRRIIFHPPRGTGQAVSDAGPPSKCKNRLFEEARLWRNRYGDVRGRMRYQFRPTTEWYKDQEEEGRGFSHITNPGPATPCWPAWTEPSESTGGNAPKDHISTQPQQSTYGQSPLTALQTPISSFDHPQKLQESPVAASSTPALTPLGMPIPMRLINKSNTPSKSILKNSGTPQPTAVMSEVQFPVESAETTPSSTAFSRMRISSPPPASRVVKNTSRVEPPVAKEKPLTVVSVAGRLGKRLRMPRSVSQVSIIVDGKEDTSRVIPAPESNKRKKRRTSETASILVTGDETAPSASKASSLQKMILPSLKQVTTGTQSRAPSTQDKTPALPHRSTMSQCKTPTPLLKSVAARPQTATPTTESAPRRHKAPVPPSRKVSGTTPNSTPKEATTIPPLRPGNEPVKMRKTQASSSFIPSSSGSGSAPVPRTTTSTGKSTGTMARPS
ncbi:hypothetical protein QBC41DRAFT_266153 [Cercophora samala]|uniref:Chromo domain-containing protein n=1 Tax=Cercophora samala TaxID=330535 RepID=A0AA40DE69_9PEZI|nr:hypothetical protein QBC41DRAFT_266153 [Cercophora samala]